MAKAATKTAATKTAAPKTAKLDTTPDAKTGIPKNLLRAQTPDAVAAAKRAMSPEPKKITMPPRTPTLPGDVAQPKLAQGNNGIHSRTAVMDNAKAARKLADNTKAPPVVDTAKKSPPKPVAGKTAPKAPTAKAPPKATTPKAVKAPAADRKITPITKTVALREGTWTHFMVLTAIQSKTTFAADALVAKHKEFGHKKMDWSWLVAKGHVKLA